MTGVGEGGFKTQNDGGGVLCRRGREINVWMKYFW